MERSVLFQEALQIVERLLREVPHLCDILPANAVDHVLRSCIILRFDESGNLLLGIGAVFQLRIAEHRVQLAGQLLAVFLGVVCDLLLQCLQQGDIEAEIAGVQGDVIPHISTVGNGGLNAADVRDSAVALRQFQFVLEVLMQPQDLLLRQIHAAAIEGVLAVLCHSIQSHFYSVLLNEPCGAQIALGTILAEDLVHPMFQRRKLGCGVLFNTGEHVEFRQPAECALQFRQEVISQQNMAAQQERLVEILPVLRTIGAVQTCAQFLCRVDNARCTAARYAGKVLRQCFQIAVDGILSLQIEPVGVLVLRVCGLLDHIQPLADAHQCPFHGIDDISTPAAHQLDIAVNRLFVLLHLVGSTIPAIVHVVVDALLVQIFLRDLVLLANEEIGHHLLNLGTPAPVVPTDDLQTLLQFAV